MSDIPIETRPCPRKPKIDVTPDHVEPAQVILTVQMIRMQAILDGEAPDEEMGKLLTNTAKTAIDQTKIKSNDDNAVAEREQALVIQAQINNLTKNPLHVDSLLHNQKSNFVEPELDVYEPVKGEFSCEQSTLVHIEK